MARIIIIRRESKVRVNVEPYLEFGAPLCDNDPLPNIEFALLYNQRRLDVLLSHPNLIHRRPNILYKAIFKTVNLDAPASGLTAWLDYPGILLAIQTVLMLTHGTPELLQRLQGTVFCVFHCKVFDKRISLPEFQVPRSPREFILSLLIWYKVIHFIRD